MRSIALAGAASALVYLFTQGGDALPYTISGTLF